jgi:protein-disulfide isomerase
MRPIMSAPRSHATRKGTPLVALAVLGFGGLLAIAGLQGALMTEARAQAAAGAPAAGTFSPEQKSAIEGIVKDYLLAHPELFLEIQRILEAKLEVEQAEKMKAALKEVAEGLYRDPNAPIAGNPKGDVTVVEFFDYNCGYCKRGLGDLVKLVEADKNVKVVFRELPILSKGSDEAARAALAARKQGKYWEFHRAMLDFKGQANEASALKIAEKLGLDIARLKTDMASEEAKAEIAKVRDIAQKLGINGTPHFLVGDRSIPGAPENLFEQLAGDVGEIRKSGCQVC